MIVSVWRLEPLGAEGQLGSMAAGNKKNGKPLAEGVQVQTRPWICTEVTCGSPCSPSDGQPLIWNTAVYGTVSDTDAVCGPLPVLGGTLLLVTVMV